MSPIKLKPAFKKKPDQKQKAPKEDKVQEKTSPKSISTKKSDLTVKFGKPVLQVTFKRIKTFVMIFVLLFLVIIFLSFDLMVTAIKIRNHLGSFINMISKGDGEILPSLLAVPIFLFLCLNMALFTFVYRIFAKRNRPGTNRVLFMLIMVALAMVLVTLMAIFVVFGHIYGSSKGIEDGIIKAMEKYQVDSFYKKQIDRLQIEFQCCGSNSSNTTTQSESTPFSCCAIKTKFPCIHFNIDTTGVNYMYVPEFNLSISPTGCHEKIVEKKRQVGLGIVGSLFLYIFFELLMLIPARFLQTGHSVDCKFEGHSKTYIVWLLGWYTGKNQSNDPPEPPPVPPELKT